MNPVVTPWSLLIAIAWFAVGVYAVISALRHRPYINSLPRTKGNLKIKRKNDWLLIFGVVVLAMQAWNTYALFIAPR